MSTKTRPDLHIADTAEEVVAAGGYVGEYGDHLVADKIDAGHGEAAVLADIGGDELTNAREAVSAPSAFALSEVSPDLVHSALDFSEISIADVSVGSGGVIGTQDANLGTQSAGLHIAPPVVDSGFMATAAALFGPAASVAAPDIWVNLTPVSFGTYGAAATIGHSGAAEATVEQTSHAVSEVATATDGMAVLASLENSVAGSPIANASVGSSGATAVQVQQALDESGLSVNGTGIKVGVLSDSFNDLGGAAADEADGALPSASNIDVIKDIASGGTDEGRAMMQIIHDIAPGASEAFYTADDSEQDFANGILALAAAGSKVIVDDVSYFDEPFFQNGVVAQAIQTVEAEGVTYVTAAGNEGSNGYQAAWTPISGTFDGRTLTDAENFGGSLVQTITINTEGTGDDVPLLLEWNQAYGAATSDLEILVFRNGSLVGTATNRSSGEPSNPWVGFDFTATGTYQVAIENLSGPNPGVIKEITEGDGLPATISGANTGTVSGHAMTPGAISSGAVSAADTPAFGFSPQSESFSSSGAGTELLFANNGAALSSPDALSPVAVSGVDDIATTVSGGLSDFYGTSASSASLAGVAALILSADPNLTPAQVEAIMEQTALPMADPAVSGAGLVQVDPAVAAAQALMTTKVIDTVGSTEFVQLGNDYYLDNTGNGSSVELKYNGALITEDEFPGWAPIGATTAATGYEVAWSLVGGNQYTVWNVDTNGNDTTKIVDAVPGSSVALESLELNFHQDINGDGVIGIPSTITEVGNDFFVHNGGSSVELKYSGAPITDGEFSGWAPIGAEPTATGYEVAWSLVGGNQYTVWNVDTNGNDTTKAVDAVSGSSVALQSLELSFHQDINGDGVIGIPSTITESGNDFFVHNGGSSVELNYGGAPITVGEFPGWAPIAAEPTSTGYEVAWSLVGGNQYTVWNVDTNGNDTTKAVDAVLGSSVALQSLELSFNQDLNGDGVIGIASTITEVGNDFFVHNGGSSVELKYGGAPITVGEFPGWAPIGAEPTANGYEVAWSLVGGNQYTVWNVDTNGNDTTKIVDGVSGTNLTLESLETSFNQDLNGDGVIGIPSGSTTGAVVAISGSASQLATIVSNDTFKFDWGHDTGGVHAGSASTIEPGGYSLFDGNQPMPFLSGELHGPPQAQLHWANEGHDTPFASHGAVPTHVHIADLHASAVFIH